MCIELDFIICLFLLHLHLIKVLPHTLALLPPPSVYAQPPRSDSHILWNKKLRSIFDPRTHIAHKPARIVLGHPGNSFTFDKGCHFCFEIDIIHGIFAWSYLLYPRSQWISDFHQVGSSAALPLIVFFSSRKCPSFLTVQPSPHFLLLHDLALHSPNSREDIEGGNDVNEMVLCGTF